MDSRAVAARAALAAILVAQAALGAAFATGTPPWQAPDEPAHFNYARQLVSAGPLPPRIERGDFPAATLDAVMSRRPVSAEELRSIEYEDHQPPLYYYIAAAAIIAAPAGGELLAVRMLGVLLALATTALCFTFMRIGWSAQPALAVGAAGTVAFLPMHLSVTASVNNDALAIPVTAAALVLSLAHATGKIDGRRWMYAVIGVLGAVLWTKLTAYVAIAPLTVATVWRARLTDRPLVRALAPLVVGMALIGPWLIRNATTYGPTDLWGLRAHDAVVEGQLTTAAFIAANGLPNLLIRGIHFTFASFWGVFGWMAVFLDERLYLLLAILSTLLGLGLLWDIRGYRLRSLPERGALALCGLVALSSLAAFAWYNLHYVQHQGRYLFTALVPFGAGVALGTRGIAMVAAMLAGRPARGNALAAIGLIAWPFAMAAFAVLALTRYVIPGLAPVP